MEQFAAVDLGSNSFHLVVVLEQEHGLKVIDRERNMVRLASGLGKNKRITEDAQQGAFECLAQFGQRIRGLDMDNVRIVGTNALRKAKNARQFIRQAEKLLGYSIEIISGVEEARLIYLGVAQTLQGDRGRRLVVDIGGGSTEVIIGDDDNPMFLESLYMGCVSISEVFFHDGKISKRRMRRAILAARVELEPIILVAQSFAAKDIIGTSGTAKAIEMVVMKQGWSETGISRVGLLNLVDEIVKRGQVKQLDFEGLGDQRQPVFAGGVAVMMAIFEALNIDFMRISEGALREGVLYDLIGRTRKQDSRAVTVRELMKRHQIDDLQAERVRAATLFFFDQVSKKRLLKRERRLLGWAAQLHEIGLMIAHSQFHRHGGYLLENMDLPGFSRQEQQAISIMVRLQRRKYEPALIDESVYVRSDALSLMSRLLRLSVLLNRGRSDLDFTDIHIGLNKQQEMEIKLKREWLANHALTRADLEQEQAIMEEIGLLLKVVEI